MKKYCNIAGLNVIIDNATEIVIDRLKKYEVAAFNDADIIVKQPDIPMLDYAKSEADYNAVYFLRESFDFYRKLLDFNGIMLHASAVVVDNKAYLFSAPSGTGKSTHTGKWLELFGSNAYILNDDKPAIRILNDGIYAYGTPWSGKHDISVNVGVPLKSICFLTRDTTNWIKTLNKQEAFIRIYHQTSRKLTSEQAKLAFDIIENIVDRIKVCEIGCTPTVEAAEMSYNFMSKLEDK